MNRFRKLACLAATAIAVTLPATARAADIELNYWMWDAFQAPIYQKCADKFEATNPGIKIVIKQDGWDNYWTSLTTGFIAGTAPDVFVNHLSHFPEYLANGLIEDVTDRIVAEKIDMNAYQPGLAKLWSKDGRQYGLPKDWDTIALVYNKQMVADAGISENDLNNLTWNSTDGGLFQKILARLSIDENGKRGSEPGFDKSKVKVYGLGQNPVDAFGQNVWSQYAVSEGFEFVDKQWGTVYRYDDPVLAKTLTWLRDLALVDGFLIPQEKAGQMHADAFFAAGKAAIVSDGSWMIRRYADSTPFKFGFAPIPAGALGRRSMFNGLSDAIWTGSQHKEEAWKWVAYLGSAECQDIIGQSGIVFPALPEATKLAIKAHEARGYDISPFTMVATPETTFENPITDHSAEINTIMKPIITNILLNQGDPAILLKAGNDQVNALF